MLSTISLFNVYKRVFFILFYFFQSQKCKLVVWMLQHQVLIQLHTYIFLSLPTQKSKKKKLSDSLLSSMPLSQCLLGRSVPDVTIDENCVLERTQSSSDIASGLLHFLLKHFSHAHSQTEFLLSGSP